MWNTLHHFVYHDWWSCLSNLFHFSVYIYVYKASILEWGWIWSLFYLLYLSIFKGKRPGLLEKHVAASGYPIPEVLFVLKNPRSRMVIDMKPGGSTGLTTCSINTFHRCATMGLDLAEGATLCSHRKLESKHTLKAFSLCEPTGQGATLHTFASPASWSRVM